MIESIRFTRHPVGEPCHAIRLGIHWTDPDGQGNASFRDWCAACDIDIPGIFGTYDFAVAHSEWLGPNHEFLAYILVVPHEHERGTGFKLEARIGVSSQWQDPRAGNVEEEGASWKSFTERYFAESGPGIYPAPIEQFTAEEALDAL